MDTTNQSKESFGLKSVGREEVQEKIKNGAQIINTLDPKFYHLGSIEGSLKIPAAELESRLSELDKNKEYITYCAGLECPASAEGGTILDKNGYNVSVYEGGIEDWKDAGLPLVDVQASKEDAEAVTKPMRTDISDRSSNVEEMDMSQSGVDSTAREKERIKSA